VESEQSRGLVVHSSHAVVCKETGERGEWEVRCPGRDHAREI